MPSLPHVQLVFNSGELDATAAQRADTQQYFQAVALGRNVRITAQGVLERRPGSRHDDVINTETQVAFATSGSKWIPFNHREQAYNLLWIPGKLLVFKPGTAGYIHVISLPKLDGLFGSQLSWTSDDENLVLFHPNVESQLITRQGDTSWTVADLPFRSVPQHHFEDTAGSNTDHVEEIDFVNFTNNDRFTIFVNGLETAPIVYSTTPATTVTNLTNAIEALPIIDADNVLVAHVVGTKYTITMQNNNSGREFAFLEGNTIFDDPTTANNLIRFSTTTKGAPPKEDVWSATRGWPACGLFYQNRLLLAGSEQRRRTIFASRVFDASDFEVPDDPLVDSPWTYTLPPDDSGRITNLFSGRHLLVGTSEGLYYAPVSSENALGMDNVFFRRTAEDGVALGFPMLDADGAVLFVHESRKSIREAIFTDTEQAYTVNDLSTLAPHLLNYPLFDGAFDGVPIVGAFDSGIISFARQKSVSTRHPDYIYCVNNDGSMAVLALDRKENVAGWSLWITDAGFDFGGESQPAVAHGYVAVGIMPETQEVYYHCRRSQLGTGETSGNLGHTIEIMDETMLFDNGARGGAASQTTDMTWLNRSSGDPVIVSTYTDGNLDVEENLTGAADGIIVFQEQSLVEWMAGLGFPRVDGVSKVLIRLLPWEDERLGQLIAGDIVGFGPVSLNFYKTRHAKLNGKTIHFRYHGSLLLDNEIPAFTGIKEIQGVLGWGRLRQFEITQDLDLPFTLRSIKTKVMV